MRFATGIEFADIVTVLYVFFGAYVFSYRIDAVPVQPLGPELCVVFNGTTGQSFVVRGCGSARMSKPGTAMKWWRFLTMVWSLGVLST